MALGKRLINTGAEAACNTDSVQAFGADNAFSSNIALYQLDGNDDDTTGNYDGTSDTGVTYSATGAKFGQAASFNGSSSKITTSSFASLSQVGISMWVNIADVTSSYALIARYGTNREFSIYNYQSSNGFIAALYYNGNNSNSVQITASDYLTNNTWHHIAYSANGSTEPKLYIDGVQVGSAQYTDSTRCAYYTTTEDLCLGGNAGLNRYLNGKIDQVRIFDKAISAEDVATLYAETSSTASNTNPFSEGAGLALWTMDFDASEASGYYDGTPTNVDFGVGGKINYGARFNGSSSYINLGTGSSGLSGLLNQKVSQSVSFWMNTSYTGISGNSIIYSVYAGGGISLNIYYLTNGTLYFLTRYTNSDTTFTTTQTFNDSQWHHIAVTIDVSSLERKIYIDNSLVSTQALSSNAYGGSGTTGVALGTNGNFNTQYYKGDLDQVRVFSKALDSTEVSTLYAETACVYTSTTDIVNYPTGTTPVAYYKLDNSSEDFSTGGNDGTDTNVEYRFGRFGQAARFSGNGYISGLPTVQNTSGEFSVSMWFNTTVNPSVQHTMLGAIKEQGTNDSVFALKMLNDGYSKLYLRGTDGTLHILADTVDATDGNWHHLVATVSSSSGVFYVDGQQVDSATISNNITVDNLLIGAENNRATLSPTNYFDGDIDQVRIYSTALTSSQVTELYNEKPETDTSTFKTVLYTGDGGTQYISNVGIDLETNGGLVWIKNRDASHNHILFDSVRGDGNGNGYYDRIMSNTTDAQQDTITDAISSLDYNGFTVVSAGSGSQVNNTNDDYVAWVWKAGGDAVSNTDGTITSQVSANTAAGFSIVTMNNASVSTVGHGLSQAPELIIWKSLTSSTNYWQVLAQAANGGNGHLGRLALQRTDAFLTVSSVWNNTQPTSTVFTLGASCTGQGVAYCFASVSGVSKIGTYEGLGTSTVTVSDVGFKPSFIMIKNVDATANWNMYDVRRSTVADRANKILYPNLSNSEPSATNYYFDMNDSGFVVSATNHEQHNFAGRTYLYMAFK